MWTISNVYKILYDKYKGPWFSTDTAYTVRLWYWETDVEYPELHFNYVSLPLTWTTVLAYDQ